MVVSGILAATVAGPRFGVGAVCGRQRRAGKAGRQCTHNRVLEGEGGVEGPESWSVRRNFGWTLQVGLGSAISTME